MGHRALDTEIFVVGCGYAQSGIGLLHLVNYALDKPLSFVDEPLNFVNEPLSFVDRPLTCQALSILKNLKR
ncbi:MAG: hypothetical protein V7K89_30440 [Nostoc sp.]|uniref:hypothetical protein n=1 Tax=Nostoc sp. TaxID=1180 RepID=UPI002FF6C399